MRFETAVLCELPVKNAGLKKEARGKEMG